ncbi:MAG: hypothetical protein GF344_13015 [Chitinivibrionales bacterium]|nr:hypothetical protein [Chitinivibrionales bacterium]
MPRSALDSYILEGLTNPRDARKTIVGMLHDVFGFDVSQTAFFRLAALLLVPFVAASIVLMAALSSIVIVEPHQQAVILRFGMLSRGTPGPGIHLKWPWPVGATRVYDIRTIRKVHVGSHQVLQDGDVFKKGVPLLWTNTHGVSGEELLIVSAPQSLVRDAARSGGRLAPGEERAPSVSLAGADICVEYSIADLPCYVTVSAQPDSLVARLAEAEASKILYRYDIDSLFTAARLEFAALLHEKLQERIDQTRLGVRVMHVGMTAVHPPLPVATAFEETVAAQQERETKIQEAHQKSIRDQVETAGSSANFAMLTSFIDSAEAVAGSLDRRAERLVLDCGGEVSKLLAEAAAYRLSRICAEQGKHDRFEQLGKCRRASPPAFENDRYLSVLETVLTEAEKTVVLADKSDILIGLNDGGGTRVPSAPVVQSLGSLSGKADNTSP